MPFWNSSGEITQYYTLTKLLGLQDEGYNLPVEAEMRYKRVKSVQKMLTLIETAMQTRPPLPPMIQQLDPTDDEWDDRIPFPIVNHAFFYRRILLIGAASYFYAYNYNTFSVNHRQRILRWLLPISFICATASTFGEYAKQVMKVNLFDEYCWLRAQELIKQNSYLFDHQDFKRYVYWSEDFAETINKIHRQANSNTEADFKDSELILQKFLDRYIDPSDPNPMKNHSRALIWGP